MINGLLFLCVFIVSGVASLWAVDEVNTEIVAESTTEVATAEIATAMVHRSDVIPSYRFIDTDDRYYEGYLQALVDMHYHEFRVGVQVTDRRVFLSNLPNNDRFDARIQSGDAGTHKELITQVA